MGDIYCLICIFQIFCNEHEILFTIIKVIFYVGFILFILLFIGGHNINTGRRYMSHKYIHVTLNCSSPFTIAFFGEFGLWCWSPEGDYHARQLIRVVGAGGTATLHEIPAITYLTPAEKLTTGKKSPSVLKFSNIPCTGCPLMRKEMLGAPRSRQQLTTSSDFRRCWLMEATALGMRPGEQRTGRRCVGLWGDAHRWGEQWEMVSQALWTGSPRRAESQRKVSSCQEWEQTRIRPVQCVLRFWPGVWSNGQTALLGVAPRVCMCVCLFIDARRPCSLLFPLKHTATSASDAGAIRVSKSKAIQPQNGAA